MLRLLLVVALAVAVGAAVLTAVLLAISTLRRPPRAPESEERALRLALAWLSFLPLLMTGSTGTTDVVLALLLLAAVLTWRRPAATTALIAAAGWFKLAPFALLPLWLAPRRGARPRRRGRCRDGRLHFHSSFW